MKILYVALKYDYGIPERGYSFEHYNFYDSLLKMGYDIFYFDITSLTREYGKEGMNRRLFEVVKTEKPELMFTILFRDELDRETVREISESTDTRTINWFCDDHWRFDDYSRHWAPCFNWVITTAKSALPKYAELGYRKVIKSQWACNQFLYRKADLPLEYDVTFIGQPHSNRRQVLQAVRDSGVDLRAWGRGWESGRISQEDMISVFVQSRINLNLSNASMRVRSQTQDKARMTRRFFSRLLDHVPFRGYIKERGGHWLKKKDELDPSTRDYSIDATFPEQIKARNFEIPGSGGFLLSSHTDDIESYYALGEEIVCFEDMKDLNEKIEYYLSNEDERAEITEAGYRRTLQEHTYVHRFSDVFRHIGLRHDSPSKILNNEIETGYVTEIS